MSPHPPHSPKTPAYVWLALLICRSNGSIRTLLRGMMRCMVHPQAKVDDVILAASWSDLHYWEWPQRGLYAPVGGGGQLHVARGSSRGTLRVSQDLGTHFSTKFLVLFSRSRYGAVMAGCCDGGARKRSKPV
jgi:hypothetical protein